MQDKVTYRFQSGCVEVEILRQGDYPIEKITEEIKEIEDVFMQTPNANGQKKYLQVAEGIWKPPLNEPLKFSIKAGYLPEKSRSESPVVSILKDDNKRIKTLNYMDDVLRKCCDAAKLYGKDMTYMSSKYIHDFHRKLFGIRTEDQLKYYDIENEYKCLIRALGLEDMPFLASKTVEELIVHCYDEVIEEEWNKSEDRLEREWEED